MNIKIFFKKLFGADSQKDKNLAQAVKQITGKSPTNVELYRLALVHSSIAKENKDGFKESNERLEYLGDAVLGMIVAEYLFKRFPYKDEGFLTEIRSRIVSRESLHNLARKTGVDKLVEYDSKRKSALSFKYLYGDAMEAFIGAVFLDRGFAFCKKFVVSKLLTSYIDLQQVLETETNYKSKIIEWSQKNGKALKFELYSEQGANHNKQFKIKVTLDGEVVAKGTGFSKKAAEQDAARKACEALQV